jgi:hypothetical protein
VRRPARPGAIPPAANAAVAVAAISIRPGQSRLIGWTESYLTI